MLNQAFDTCNFINIGIHIDLFKKWPGHFRNSKGNIANLRGITLASPEWKKRKGKTKGRKEGIDISC